MSDNTISRRQFVAQTGAVAAGAAAAMVAAKDAPAAETEQADAPEPKGKPTMKIGFHTDAFNSAYFSFEKCLQWAEKNDVHRIECGLIDGVSWIHGLGYQPHVALYEDPVMLRRKMEDYGVQFSQVDAAYPLSGSDGPLYGVPYVLKSIPWAKNAGCERIATTDGLHRPEGLDDDTVDKMNSAIRDQIQLEGEYLTTSKTRWSRDVKPVPRWKS